MKIKDLVAALQKLPQEGDFLVANDEELNTLYKTFQIGVLDNNEFCIYGLSGSEVEE